MHLSDFRSFISSLAVITTVLQFLSGILVVKEYVVKKTTADSSPLPFLCGVISAGLWLFYGLTKHDDKIVLVNTIGVTMMASYVTVYYIYTFKKSTLLKQIFACVVLATFVVRYILTEDNKETLLTVLGISACCLTLVAIAAPMSQLFYVMKVRNTSCLPFPMILMSFIVSTLWLLYGLIEKDEYLIMPNFIGAVLAISQLSLFVIYPSQPTSPSQNKTLLA